MKTLRNLKNILIIRTDRIGDVVLSTPVIAQIHSNFPEARISFLTTPYTEEILKGNPLLYECVIYDKKGRHKNFFSGIIAFSFYLRKKKYDAVFVLHPTQRMHIVTWLAGIPVRIGWDRKLGNFLTHRIRHEKHLGLKHETEYTLDLLRSVGLKTTEPVLDIARDRDRINSGNRYIVLGIGASCPSKLWSPGKFAYLAKMIHIDFPDKEIAVLASENEKNLTCAFHLNYSLSYLDLSGKTSINDIKELFYETVLFIGNDSGLAHLAASLGVPTVTIFGRSDSGLSPRRWKPLSDKSLHIHKPRNCSRCLAHDCKNDFYCIDSITPQEVFELVKKILI